MCSKKTPIVSLVFVLFECWACVIFTILFTCLLFSSNGAFFVKVHDTKQKSVGREYKIVLSQLQRVVLSAIMNTFEGSRSKTLESFRKGFRSEPK